MKPYIIDKIVYNDGSEIQYEPEPIRRVIKESTSDTMITMLIDSVENGVAKLGAVEGYSIA
jgi:membrane peptidoglycan carboxypeptidase